LAYKLRWEIEKFFAWWKRHLKVYHLIGPSGKSVGNPHAPRRVWPHVNKVGLRSEETAKVS